MMLNNFFSNFSFALTFSFSGIICARVKSSFKKLDSYTGKHKNEQHRDQDNVLDSSDSDKHALDHVF